MKHKQTSSRRRTKEELLAYYAGLSTKRAYDFFSCYKNETFDGKPTNIGEACKAEYDRIISHNNACGYDNNNTETRLTKLENKLIALVAALKTPILNIDKLI